MGVGLLEHRGGLGGAWAGKACPEAAGTCRRFISPRGATWRLSLPSPQAKQRSERSSDKGGAGTRIGGLGDQRSDPGYSGPPFPSIPPPPLRFRPKLSNFPSGERVPGAPRDALR